jgi:hypothetical protein
MESHDEERTMYKNLKWGNSNGSYSVKNLSTALKRQELTGAFFFLLPGPKIIWEFGELGYDFSINRCTDGSINENCRLSPKPIRWDYQNIEIRKTLFNKWSSLIKLKKEYDVFNTSNFSYKLSSYQKSIHLNSDKTNVTIIGNFDVKTGSIDPQFQHTGWWYDYFLSDSINVISTNNKINLQPGEYHIYTDKKLSETTNTFENNLVNNFLSIYPNPISNELNIYIYSNKNQKITIEIFDISGKSISRIKRNTIKNYNSFKINTNRLNKGIYIIKIPELNIIKKFNKAK